MPDMANLLISPSPPPLPPSQPPALPSSTPSLKPSDASAFNLLVKAAEADNSERVLNNCKENGEVRALKRSRSGGDKPTAAATKKNLDEHVKDWVQRRIDAGVPQHKCFFPFLTHAPKMVECYLCPNSIYPGDELECSIRGCNVVCHLICVKQKLGVSSLKEFKCPQHACYLCNKKNHLWRCTRCQIASHDKCAAFPEHVIHFHDQPGKVICWRHPTDLRLNKQAVPENNIEEIFSQLPLPCVEEEFKIDINWKDSVENTSEPPPYLHIRRNIYLIKKKRDHIGADIGCTNCKGTECSDDCVCRVQCISCSKACRCSEMCCNRPFRKEKKIKIVKTEFCGWGVVAAEPINKGDFIIEYVGEVIDDVSCEKRLWDMKDKGVTKFYMCEIRKDFTIDATFKGNSSRFLNHSCDPNCNLEKWQVEGETRVGVFAARSIEVGEPLTYDYRFVQFGAEVKCHCGAPNCQGYLGTKKKIEKVDLHWGSKRRRTSTSSSVIIRN